MLYKGVMMGIKVVQLIERFKLTIVNEGLNDCEITAVESNRCGLQLSGFFRRFERRRIQIIGNAEKEFLETLGEEDYRKAFSKLMDQNPPCIILAHGNKVTDEVVEMAKEANQWILTTEEHTSKYLIDQTIYLTLQLAEKITLHGVLMDVYGVGVLIIGDSGVGKSETAISLIRQGHMLVADDAVEIKRVNSELLMGTSHELTRNLIECRGIGIVNINSLFGKSAIRLEGPVEIIMHLVKWDDNVDYDRVHGDFSTKDILGIDVPVALIPVKPGRDLAAIVEIGALNFRQNKMGHNTAQELSQAIKLLTK